MNDRIAASNKPGKRLVLLYAVCSVLMLVILAADCAVPLGVAMGVPYVLVVLISLWAPQKKFTLAVALFASLFTAAAFFLKPPVFELWKAVFNRALALFAIWVTAWLGLERKNIEEKREQAVAEREKALEQARVLRGLLPICASCKKIRNDKGYWTQIETYISEHSEAEFTHGICPECAIRLYPKYREQIEAGRNGPPSDEKKPS